LQNSLLSGRNRIIAIMVDMRLKKSGFTLIEVILASIILIISILGGTAFFSINRKSLVFATCQRLATWSAIYKIEELKSMDYAALALLPSPTTENNLSISGKFFQRKTTISDIGGYKQVTVAMDWGQGNFPVSLTTYISDRTDD